MPSHSDISMAILIGHVLSDRCGAGFINICIAIKRQ
jgi:hypothetical protein